VRASGKLLVKSVKNVWMLLRVCWRSCATLWRHGFNTAVSAPSLPVRVRCRCRTSRVQAQRQRGDVSSSFPAWGAWHHVPPASWASAVVPARRCVSHNRASGNVRAGGASCHTCPTQQRFPAFPLWADASTKRRKRVTPCRLCAVLGTIACWYAERVRQGMAQ
jgi:hypothetical protein